MKYLIMMVIVLGLAITDFLTGILKAYVKCDISSQKMRKGGANKITELIVMGAICGLEFGIGLLGNYYQSAELAQVFGVIASGAVFTYIVIMEIISILENYSEISPDATWIHKIIRKLRDFNGKDDKK